MSSTRTTVVLLAAALALGAPGCVEVVIVKRDSGTAPDANTADSGSPDPGSPDAGDGAGDASLDGGAEDAIVTGTPEGEWHTVTNNLANLPAQCGTLTTIAASPFENRLVVGIAGNGIYTTTDGGESWSRLGTGAGSVTIGARVSQFVFDPEYEDTYYVSGIYGSPGVMKTTDNGTTFKGLGDAWHNDSLSVDFTDPQRKTLLAGTHEQSRVLWRSTDSGATWKNIGEVLPTEAGWSLYPLVIDAQTYLMGSPGSGVFRTENGGTAWTRVSESGGGAPPLVASDGSIYWASAGNMGLARSTDDGANWSEITPAGIVYSITPVELPDGRIATRGPRGVLVSDDFGEHWQVVAPPEPYTASAEQSPLVYSIDERAFFVSQAACSTAVAPDAVQRFDWDYE